MISISRLWALVTNNISSLRMLTFSVGFYISKHTKIRSKLAHFCLEARSNFPEALSSITKITVLTLFEAIVKMKEAIKKNNVFISCIYWAQNNAKNHRKYCWRRNSRERITAYFWEQISYGQNDAERLFRSLKTLLLLNIF